MKRDSKHSPQRASKLQTPQRNAAMRRLPPYVGMILILLVAAFAWFSKVTLSSPQTSILQSQAGQTADQSVGQKLGQSETQENALAKKFPPLERSVAKNHKPTWTPTRRPTPTLLPTRTPKNPRATATATRFNQPQATRPPTRIPTLQPTRPPNNRPSPTPTRIHSQSGLPVILYNDLPREAKETIRLIDQDGPFPFWKDDTEFQNRERKLPRKPRDYYREFTVITPNEDDRGARRIIEGAEGELYYTDDHYDSFREVVR